MDADRIVAALAGKTTTPDAEYSSGPGFAINAESTGAGVPGAEYAIGPGFPAGFVGGQPLVTSRKSSPEQGFNANILAGLKTAGPQLFEALLQGMPPGMMDPTGEIAGQQNIASQQRVQQQNAANKDLLDTWGGAIGNIAPQIALTAPVRGPAAAIGALQSLLTPNEPGETGLLRAGAYAVGGKLGEKLGQTLGTVGKWGWNKLAEGTPALEQLPTDIAQRWQAITDVGAKPALANVTGRPQDWYDLEELGKNAGKAKDQFVQRVQDNAAALRNYFSGLGKGTGETAYSAAQILREAAEGWSTGSQKEVSNLYQVARDTTGAGVAVPMQPIADELGKVAQDFGDLSNIPSGVTSALNKYGLMGGNQTMLLTVQDAEQLRKVIGNNIDWSHKPSALVGVRLQNSVDEATGQLADTVGGDAAQAFQDARGAARDRFAQLKPSIMTKLVATDEMSPNFIRNSIINGKPGEIADTRATISKNSPQAWDAVHDSVLDYIKAKSVDSNGNIIGSRLGNVLDTIGPERLDAMFPPDTVAGLNTARTAAEALTTVPNKSGINFSGSGNRMLNAFKSPESMRTMGAVLGNEMLPGVGGILLGGAAGSAGAGAINWNTGRQMRRLLTPEPSAVAKMFAPPVAPTTLGELASGASARLGAAGLPIASPAALNAFLSMGQSQQ